MMNFLNRIIIILYCVCGYLSAQEESGWINNPGYSQEEINATISSWPIETSSGTPIDLAQGGSIAAASSTAPVIPVANFAVTPTANTAGSTTDQITPEIAALARGLNYDPVTIFNFVRNRIEYECYFGSKKGAHLTLLEMGGNDYDQSALLVSLLRASGYAASYVSAPVLFSYDYMLSATGLRIPFDSMSNAEVAAYISTPTLTILPTDPDLPNKRKQYGVSNFLFGRGFPGISRVDSAAGMSFHISHVWVRCVIGETTYNLSPSIKTYSKNAGINIVPTGMTKASILTAAGGSVDTSTGNKWVKNIGYNNLASVLSGYTNQVLAEMKSTYDAKSMDEILPARKIVPEYIMSLAAAHPVVESAPGWASLEKWDGNAIPDNRLSKLTLLAANYVSATTPPQLVGYPGYPGYQKTFTMPELGGKKLSLTFGVNGAYANTATFSLDDTVAGAVYNMAPNTHLLKVGIRIQHPHYSLSYDNVTKTYSLSGLGRHDVPNTAPYYTIHNYSSGISPTAHPGNTVPYCYALVSSFENPHKLIKKRQQILEKMRQSGLQDSDSRVRTEVLNIIGLSWYQQTWLYTQMTARMMKMLPLHEHRFGTVAQQNHYYIDITKQVLRPRNEDLNPNLVQPFGGIQSMQQSAMEHSVIDQSVGRPVAVSTVDAIKRGNDAGDSTYRMASATWTADKGNLSDYSPSDLNFLNNQFATAGGIGLLPKNGAMTVNNWLGTGYFTLTSAGTYNFMITNGLSGGIGSVFDYVGSNPLLDYLRSDPAYLTAPSNPIPMTIARYNTPQLASYDPIDLLSGAFFLDKTDLELGGISALRSYNSHQCNNDQAGLGNGWTHGNDIRLAERTSISPVFGNTNSYQAAALYVCALASSMVYDDSSAKPWTTSALIAYWGADMIKNRAVAITYGNKTLEFIKMPNGTFISPPGMNYILTVSGGTPATATADAVLGIYTLAERNGNTYLFNTKGKIDKITDNTNNITQFTYNAEDQLLTVANAFNHVLTYTWLNGKISRITDNSFRTIHFSYINGNLTGFTDAEGKTWTYQYNSENRIYSITDPQSRLLNENYYDFGGRVIKQYSMGLATKAWHYAWSGFANLELNPAAGLTSYHYDEKGRSVGISDALGNHSRLTYDGQDRIVSSADAKGQTSTRSWNNDNNLDSEVDPVSQTTSYFYDTKKRIQRIHDKRGNDTVFEYTTKHQLEKITDPLGHITTYGYYSNGRLHTVKDGEGKITTTLYDDFGSPNKITYHDTTFQSMTNNTHGDVLTVTDAEGRLVTNTYNKRRQLLTTMLPPIPGQPVAVITNVYDDSGNLQSTTDAKGNIISHTYNALANNDTTTLPALEAGDNVITSSYDFRDWATGSINSLGHTVTTEYDAAKRPSAFIDALNRRIKPQFDPNGQLIETEDPLNRIKKQVWTARGEQERSTDALSKNTDFVYDANGNHTFLTNRRGKLYEFVYDDANRHTKTITPSGKTTLMEYFDNNLVWKITEPSLQLTTMFYNGKNLISGKIDPVGTITYGYDNSGLLEMVVENSITITRSYDERGRLKDFTTADGDFIQYQYDDNNNLTRLTYPPDATYPAGKQVNYIYNARNLLETVTDWSNRVTTYQYDRLGRLTGTIRPNGTSNQIAHDAANQLTSIKESSAGKLISYLVFQYDAASQTKSRFRAPIVSSGWQHPTFAATYDDDNRLATVNGSLVSHDVDGNMTYGPIKASAGVPPAAVNLAYNSRNQLTNAVGISYTYDAEGRRRTLTDTSGTTRDIIDPSGKLLVRINPDSTRTYYVYGLGLLYEVGDQSNATKTYHFDQVGSTIVRTNDAGSVIGKAEYSAYGLITWKDGDMATPFLYNGQAGVQTDPNGLLNMRARYYSPYLMRFLNADPIGFSGGSNWFAYADGNPISLSDPFGLCAESGWGRAGEFANDFWDGASNYTWRNLSDDVAVSTSWGLYALAETINLPFKVSGTDPMALGPLGGAEMGLVGGLRSLASLRMVATYADDLGLAANATAKAQLWTATKTKTPVENAFGHWQKHGAEFPEFQNAKQYVEGTKNFFSNSPAGTLNKVRANGDNLFFNPANNTFGVQSANGAPRTMFRPTEGINYWNKQ